MDNIEKEKKAVIGPAGYGKTTEPQRFAAINPNAAYLGDQGLKPDELHKEICFCLNGSRPSSYQVREGQFGEKFREFERKVMEDMRQFYEVQDYLRKLMLDSEK